MTICGFSTAWQRSSLVFLKPPCFFARNYCSISQTAVDRRAEAPNEEEEDTGALMKRVVSPQAAESKPVWKGPRKLSHSFLLPAMFRWGNAETKRRADEAAAKGKIRYVVAYQRCTGPRGPKLLWVKGDLKEYKIVQWDEVSVFDTASRFINIEMLSKIAKAIPSAKEKAFDMQDITEGDVFLKLHYLPKIVKNEKYIREVIRMSVFDSLFFHFLRRAEDNFSGNEKFAVEALERLFKSCLAPYANMDTAYALQEAVSVVFKKPTKIVNSVWIDPDPSKPYIEQLTLLEEIMEGLPAVDNKIVEEYPQLLPDQHARGLCLVVLSSFMYAFHKKCNFDVLSNNTELLKAASVPSVEETALEDDPEMAADDLTVSDLVEDDLNELSKLVV